MPTQPSWMGVMDEFLLLQMSYVLLMLTRWIRGCLLSDLADMKRFFIFFMTVSGWMNLLNVLDKWLSEVNFIIYDTEFEWCEMS